MIWADYMIVGALLLWPLAEARERWFGPDEGWFIKDNWTRNLVAFVLIGLVAIGMYFQDVSDLNGEGPQILSRFVTAFVRVF